MIILPKSKCHDLSLSLVIRNRDTCLLSFLTGREERYSKRRGDESGDEEPGRSVCVRLLVRLTDCWTIRLKMSKKAGGQEKKERIKNETKGK